MHNDAFQNANKVFVGVLHMNKKNGLDTRKAKTAITKPDLEKLYENYLVPGLATGDTEILQHKIFIDLVYLMGRRGKEGLRKLQKDWFKISTDAEGTEYVEIIVRETTKKNQGDNLSATANVVHDDNNPMFAQPNSPRCPVDSFKQYMKLLNPKLNDFFQRPSKDKMKYDAAPVGKNTIGAWMGVISQRAGLSRKYMNHQLKKTCGTGLRKGGIALPNIAHHLHYKDLQSLQFYLDQPSLEDKKRNAAALHNYTVSDPSDRVEIPSDENLTPPQAQQQVLAQANIQPMPAKENIQPQNALIPFESNLQQNEAQAEVQVAVQDVPTTAKLSPIIN